MPSSPLLIALAPGAAVACLEGMSAGGHACSSAGSGMIGAALLAAVAAVGWEVIRHASKESGAVKTAGQIIGWLLAVGGVAGFLCGVACHAGSRMRSGRTCEHHGAPSTAASGTPAPAELPPGHPPLDGRSPRRP